ncbi:MAG: glycoside hydrolase 43 family protein [Muribaculaceae bacterium]|nr:glycoside hydrolase 43 family protein [Muribaculaceae bacterium]
MKKLFASLLAVGLSLCAVYGGSKQYANPVIHADYSDPDVTRVGDDYWMVASSFNAMPGIPVLHSRNLVDWEIVGHVYDSLPFSQYDRPNHGEGAWAPSIRYHKGMFYVYFCTPTEGLFVATAQDPRGPWQLRQMADVAKWEDPCPFWDEDGSAYLVRSKHRGGPAILHRMSPDGLTLLDDGVTVYCDTVANPVLEGLKMMKRKGWYYILAPAGGVGSGWQTVLRSRSPYGPYESKRVLEQGSTDINGPHQGGLVDTPDGSQWWFLHFQEKGIHGRVVHLQPARWSDDGWLEMGRNGQPVRTFDYPKVGVDVDKVSLETSDEFADTVPGLQWQWQGNPRPDWYSLTDTPGWLRLNAVNVPTESGNLYYAPSLMLQKIPAERFTATTKVEPHMGDSLSRAGLVMMGKEYSYIAATADSVLVVTGRGDKRFPVSLKTEAAAPYVQSSLWLRVELLPGDKCQYSYSADGQTFTELGQPCAVTPGVWIGAKTGLFCITPSVVPSGSYALFDMFEVDSSLQHPAVAE